MFYPPSLLDLSSERPQPRPVYDIPPVIVRPEPLRAVLARLMARRRSATSRVPHGCPCPEPSRARVG